LGGDKKKKKTKIDDPTSQVKKKTVRDMRLILMRQVILGTRKITWDKQILGEKK